MPFLRALQDMEEAAGLAASAPTVDTAETARQAGERIIDIYSSIGIAVCFLSLLAAAAVAWKLARRPMLFSKSGRSVTHGPHSMKRFMDSVVLVMSIIDVIFAAVLVITLTVTWRLFYFQGDQNHWIWWWFANFCWLPQFYHCYIASTCFNWVVRR
ncbi:hypothetical protein VYU27_009939, partial [Nannochloropsis oceanica]